jgi:hypothetical protein
MTPATVTIYDAVGKISQQFKVKSFGWYSDGPFVVETTKNERIEMSTPIVVTETYIKPNPPPEDAHPYIVILYDLFGKEIRNWTANYHPIMTMYSLLFHTHSSEIQIKGPYKTFPITHEKPK